MRAPHSADRTADSVGPAYRGVGSLRHGWQLCCGGPAAWYSRPSGWIGPAGNDDAIVAYVDAACLDNDWGVVIGHEHGREVHAVDTRAPIEIEAAQGDARRA